MRKTRFLIVDDDAVIRLAVMKCLADDPSAEVTTSSSGDEARSRLAGGEPIDWLQLDWNMPGLNGYELLRAVRADACSVTFRQTRASHAGQRGGAP